MTFVLPRGRAVLLAGAALLFGACSPTFNWREVPIGGEGEVVALLPCKPDRARRDLPLGDRSVPVTMIGCEAGGATFAVALASADDAAQADGWLGAWKRQAHTQWAGGRIEERSAVVNHAAVAPAPWLLEAAGGRQHQQVRQLWFAHRQRNGAVSLYQATVLGTPSAAEATQTFFEGLRLP